MPRRSFTVTVPSCALVLLPGEALGRIAPEGTVLVSGPAAIVIEVGSVAVWLLASVTLIVKLDVPAAAWR